MNIYTGTATIDGKIASMIFGIENEFDFEGKNNLIYPNLIQKNQDELYFTPLVDYCIQKDVKFNGNKMIAVSEATPNLSDAYMELLAQALNNQNKDISFLNDFDELDDAEEELLFS